MDEPTQAISALRAKAHALRTTTVQHLEAQLACNPNPDWRELMGTLDVMARRLADLRTETAPVLRFLAFQPRKPTANTSDLPMMLGTRPLPETEAVFAADLAAKEHMPDDIRRFNASMLAVEEVFAAEAQRVMRGISSTGATRAAAAAPPT